MSQENLFTQDQDLNKICDTLVKHLIEHTTISMTSQGKINIYIPENGDVSWWFDELIEVVLRKVADKDTDIVKKCLDKGIQLFTIIHNEI